MLDSLRDRLRQAYDGGAEARESGAYPKWKKTERAGFLSQLRAHGLTRFLEVGAGTGRDSKFFADEGCMVTCIDLSPEMVRSCQTKGLEARVMDVADLSFEDGSFDAVYSFNSLLHLPKAELPAVLGEIRRVLRPAGLFFFGSYGGFDHEGTRESDDHDPPRFFSFYGDNQLQDVVSKAFDILKFRSVAVNGHDKRLHFQSLLLRRP
ncbi:class I SAM-dependent methyltransferase [Candidatus Bipolaricaulota bacterium]